MDAGGIHRRLEGWEIHGFRTMEDLDVPSMFVEARERWLRPNEIHAILCNYTNFNISMKPVNLPKSGTLVLFDRKMLRNFRKDGHNWKKKKDGKTVKEAHEHLKVGDEERIHVYYAHGEDNPTFVRRCYWLLDKKLEHIVLVHYRTTQELKVSMATPVNSKSSSTYSNPSASGVLSEEIESADGAYFTSEKGNPEHATLENHEMRLREINTLEWEELLATNDPVESMASRGANSGTFLEQHTDMVVNGSKSYVRPLPARNMQAESLSCGIDPAATINSGHFDSLDSVGFKKMEDQTNPNMPEILDDSLDISVQDTFQTQDSFGRWINCFISAPPGSVDNSIYESPISTGHGSNVSSMTDEYQSAVLEQIFSITDISPAWGFSTEETKILVIGFFHGEQQRHGNCNLLCVCGDAYVPVEKFQVGVFRAVVPPHTPGLVNFFLSFDGHRPISQIITFEYRVPLTISPEHKPNLEEFQVQMRLAHLLFSTSSMLRILSSKVLQSNLKKAREFTLKTSHTATQWTSWIKLIEDKKFSFPQVNDCLFEHALENRLKEWLVERIVEGAKITEQDNQGQGVIHLCAILGYTWAVRLFALSGISLNSRDKSGWTAIHWAAHSGREKMVAALLSAGAKPNLVTDPTPMNPGGYTAADLASKMGHDGLGAYLAEKSLVEHFKDMTIAGNVSGSLQISTTDSKNTENLTEDEVYLKDSLSAYRTAADAAARIQTAFREHSLKVQTKAVETSNPEAEARNIVAAMKIQHAFRNHEMHKKMAAAARIQHRFRSWKIRREFLNMRRQAIKIQAAFRGFQVRRQYHKIVWSVGVLEKAILRWRLKRKGFRGLQASPIGEDTAHGKENDTEEDFFRASRKQAEERIERSVVRVQAMFRSRQAQQEYHRMKLACDQAKLELEAELDPDFEMDGGGSHF